MKFFGPFTKLSQVLIDDIDKWLPYDVLYTHEMWSEKAFSNLRYWQDPQLSIVLEMESPIVTFDKKDLMYYAVNESGPFCLVGFETMTIRDDETCVTKAIRILICRSLCPTEIISSGFFIISAPGNRGYWSRDFAFGLLFDLLPKFPISPPHQ